VACWDRCFALPQLLYRWRHQSGIFWIPPRTVPLHSYYNMYHQTTARILASHISMAVGTIGKSMQTTCVAYKITRLQAHSIFMHRQVFCTLR
jgi:hypothetical protein